MKLSISLWVASRPETGETFVVPTEKDIAEMRTIETASLDQLLDGRRQAGEKADTSARARANAIGEMEARYTRWLSDANDARQYARETTFEINKPTFGDQRRAYSTAQKLDYENAQSVIDAVEYQTQLLIAALGGEDKVDALEPAVAQELRARVFRMVHPDQKRLPFVAGPPSNA